MSENKIATDAREIAHHLRKIEVQIRGLDGAKQEIAAWLKQLDRQCEQLKEAAKELSTSALYAFAMSEEPKHEELCEKGKKAMRVISQNGVAMFMDIHEKMGGSQKDVVALLNRLIDAGLVETRNGAGYALTPAGGAAINELAA